MKRAFGFMLFVMFLGLAAFAQDKPAPDTAPQPERVRREPVLNFYKLEFVLRELQDGKPINSRNYLMTVENGERGTVQTGSKVPVNSGIDKSLQYMDVGVNIQCRALAKEDYVTLHTSVELSNFALPEQMSGSGAPPVLRNMRAVLPAAVPFGKQTVIGSVDDPNSTKRYEISVTATKLR